MVINVGQGGQYHRIDAAVAKADADTDLGNYYTINIAPGSDFHICRGSKTPAWTGVTP